MPYSHSGVALLLVICFVATFFPHNVSCTYITTTNNITVSISKFSLNETLFDEGQLVYTTLDNQGILIRTTKGDVWHTFNGGISWSMRTISSVMENVEISNSKVGRIVKGALLTNQCFTIYMMSGSPDHSQSNRQRIWTSLDGGYTWALRYNIPLIVDNILPHPYFPGVAIFSQIGAQSTRSQLHITFDAGKSFNALFFPVVAAGRYSWACTAEYPQRMVLQAFTTLTAAITGFWNSKLFLTDDFFSNYRILNDRVADWSIHMIKPINGTREFSSSWPSATLPTSNQSPLPPVSDPNLVNVTSPIFHQQWPFGYNPTYHVAVNRIMGPQDYSETRLELSIDMGFHWEYNPPLWPGSFFPLNGVMNYQYKGHSVRKATNDTWWLSTWNTNGSRFLYASNVIDGVHDTSTQNLFQVIGRYEKVNSYLPFSYNDGNMIAGFWTPSSCNERTHLPCDPWAPPKSTSVSSKVTFNGGMTWHRILSPNSTWDGIPYTCSQRNQLLLVNSARNLVNNDNKKETNWLPINEDESSIDEECFLTLRTHYLDQAPLLYSVPGSLATLVATGAVSNSTDPRVDMNTYVSSDGGRIWRELGPGYLIPEFGANGALLAVGEDGGETNSILVSMDDGYTWKSIQFANETYNLVNIRVANDYNSRTLLIHAARANPFRPPAPPPILASPPNIPPSNDDPPSFNHTSSPTDTEEEQPSNAPEDMPTSPSTFDDPSAPTSPSSPPISESPSLDGNPIPAVPVVPVPPLPRWESALFAVDFSDSFAACTPQDYEPWTPSNFDGTPVCYHGLETTYLRRKKGHFCFPQPPAGRNQANSPWPIVISVKPCTCGFHDYQCSFCFEWDNSLERCVFTCSRETSNVLSKYANLQTQVPSIPDSCSFSNSSGYYVWKDSYFFAYQLNPYTKCKDNILDVSIFPDALIPCHTPGINAPYTVFPTSPIAKSTLSKLIIVPIISGMVGTAVSMYMHFCGCKPCRTVSAMIQRRRVQHLQQELEMNEIHFDGDELRLQEQILPDDQIVVENDDEDGDSEDDQANERLNYDTSSSEEEELD